YPDNFDSNRPFQVRNFINFSIIYLRKSGKILRFLTKNRAGARLRARLDAETIGRRRRPKRG
ncbi:MAG: hypothetical protein II486_09950, partial [Thermoguttaceae bacterium]|nr:hypothetical protein [Thermoguttaceae bacterium]